MPLCPGSPNRNLESTGMRGRTDQRSLRRIDPEQSEEPERAERVSDQTILKRVSR
jgi:hypothetical protein